MHIKLLESEAEYRASLAVRNTVVDYAPMTYEESKERDRVRPAHRELVRWVGYEDETVVARIVLQEHDDPTDRTYHTATAVVGGPGHHARALTAMEFLLEQASLRKARRVLAEARNDHPEHVNANIALGFETKQRNPMSAATLRDLDLDPVEVPGVQLTTCDQLLAELGEPFYRLYWRLHMDIVRDVPSPVPFVETPYEDFRGEFSDSFLDKSALHVALIDGEMVGVSEFAQNRKDKTQGITYLPGVRREARRRGIATAIKKRAMADARSRGIEVLWTDNEEGNPMYTLNLKLGFEKQFEWHFMVRDLG